MIPIDEHEIRELNVAADRFERDFSASHTTGFCADTFVALMQTIRRFARIAETEFPVPTRTISVQATFRTPTAPVSAIVEGYEGIACGRCGMFKMKRAGTCLVCHACGENTGCG